MSISRRSFLKIAGLSAVAVAGTALFAGCSVASYLQIQLDEKLRKEITKGLKPEEVSTANAMIDAYVGIINAALLLAPLVGVDSLDKNQVFDTLNKALEQYEKQAPDKADEIAKIREWTDKVDIVTDESGKIKATGFGYAKITVTLTIKSSAATQALGEALAAAV